MLRRFLFAILLLLAVTAGVGALAAAEPPPTWVAAGTAELDVRGLKIGMPFAAAPRSLNCQRIGDKMLVECLPEAGATIELELAPGPGRQTGAGGAAAASGERIARVSYSFYSREKLAHDTKIGAVLVAKYGPPKETLDGWIWRRGSVMLTASVPGDMQHAVLRLEDPEFLKRVEQEAKTPEGKPGGSGGAAVKPPSMKAPPKR